ncbi:OadG family protein [Eubacterium sp. AB3007]|uniref:OadG family protein n=1 Tax=Eubacterium sp. AB3007 TaxID=1392487 RepID=UPI00068D378D|nr:OadG family protein [Eubacterium sp. AB3007]
MSIGEICKIAGIDTILGMGTVFLILIIISIFIWLLGVLTGGVKAAGQSVVETPAPVAELSAREDDAQLVAVIMAAIRASKAAEGENVDDDAYVVRNIRRATWKYTQSE